MQTVKQHTFGKSSRMTMNWTAGGAENKVLVADPMLHMSLEQDSILVWVSIKTFSTFHVYVVLREWNTDIRVLVYFSVWADTPHSAMLNVYPTGQAFKDDMAVIMRALGRQWNDNPRLCEGLFRSRPEWFGMCGKRADDAFQNGTLKYGEDVHLQEKRTTQRQPPDRVPPPTRRPQTGKVRLAVFAQPHEQHDDPPKPEAPSHIPNTPLRGGSVYGDQEETTIRGHVRTDQ